MTDKELLGLIATQIDNIALDISEVKDEINIQGKRRLLWRVY